MGTVAVGAHATSVLAAVGCPIPKVRLARGWEAKAGQHSPDVRTLDMHAPQVVGSRESGRPSLRPDGGTVPRTRNNSLIFFPMPDIKSSLTRLSAPSWEIYCSLKRLYVSGVFE